MNPFQFARNVEISSEIMEDFFNQYPGTQVRIPAYTPIVFDEFDGMWCIQTSPFC